MALRFNPPPNWPPAPAGWTPPDGWRPDPAWGPIPGGWQLWVEVPAAPAMQPVAAVPVVPGPHAPLQPSVPHTASTTAAPTVDVPIFGARAMARDLSSQVHKLEDQGRGLQAENARLNAELRSLTSQLKQANDEVVVLTSRVKAQQSDIDRLGIRPVLELEQQIASLQQQAATESANLETRRAALAGVEKDIVAASDLAALQEVGIYAYRHVLTDSVAYKSELARLQDKIKIMARQDGGAVLATTSWTVNGSASEGRAMVRDFSKLMLRAYNAEAEAQVRGMKPYKLTSAVDRLAKVTQAIARLGKTMDIRIADAYHKLRVKELELTADYLEKLAEEKQREREERARLREERLLQQEVERELARLDKERQHYENALTKILEQGNVEAAAQLQGQLAEIQRAIEDVDARAANVRAGYVYVISNLGSFGERMVKIGMTRRLDPMDRIRELSDASVPFNFDVHALFFSDDAVGIETQMHRRLADRRVNQVNLRREFFYATPQEVKQHLLELAGNLLQYTEDPEAVEFRQSRTRTPDPQL